LTVLLPHVLVDESERDGNRSRVASRAALMSRLAMVDVPTPLVVLGESRFGRALFGTAEVNRTYDELVALAPSPGTWRDRRDSIITVTAQAQGATLVTNDRAATTRARIVVPQLEVITLAEFDARLDHEEG
jgi:hypothetical protein